MSVHNVILWRVFFYIKLKNKGHIKRKRKSIAENLAYLFWQYFNMHCLTGIALSLMMSFANLSCKFNIDRIFQTR